MTTVRNETDAPVCAIAPRQTAQVDPAHRAVAAALAAGHLVEVDAPTPVNELRAENARLKAENAALRAERDQLLALATEPKPASRRVAREG